MDVNQWLKFTTLELDLPHGTKKGKVLKKVKKTLQKQQKGNWCWAATAVSIDHYYEDSPWTQCKVANAFLYPNGECDCCKAENLKNKKTCNSTGKLGKALSLVQNFDGNRDGNTQASFETLCAEIDENRPLCMAIRRKPKRPVHFLILSGYGYCAKEKPMVVIANVNKKTICTMPFDIFPAQYHSGGTWDWTYWTTPQEATSKEG